MLNKKRTIICTLLILSVIFLFNINNSYSLSPSSQVVYEGVDVSNWQGYINYAQVKNSGIEVVYIKTSEGMSFKDPYFEYNYENAKANGLKVGFYHFLTATNTTQARNQAQFFASVISGKTPDCKLAMDFEQFNGGISVTQINEIALVFMQRLEELTGKEIIVYSNLNDAQRIFNSEISNKYPLWLAYWGNYNNLQDVNSSWQTWEGIQYTNRGVVPGINGYVDRNRFTQNILLGECTNCPSIEPPEEDTQEVYYVVKSGDTLSQIANRYRTTVNTLASINNISNPNLIFPGQIIRIMSPSNNTENETNEMGHSIYTVKRGDNLWNISRKYEITVQEILNVNNILNPNLIFPGQKLRIPLNKSNLNAESNINTESYIVKRGDTLWRISQKYGVTVRYLSNLNGIRNPNLIYPGQIIKIR